MRPQDEILLTLPRQPPPGRRFLLRRLGNLPQAEDIRHFHDSVRKIADADPNDIAAALAEDEIWEKRELERLRRSVGEESGQGGTWTSFLMPAVSSERPDDIRDAGIAAGQALESILEPLSSGAARGPAEARWVAQALGRIQSHASIDLLMKIATDHGAIAPAVLGLASLGGDLAAEKAMLLTKAVEGTSVHPGLLRCFGKLPTAKSYAFLLKQLQRGNPEVSAGVAVALEGFDSFDPIDALKALSQSKDPWVLINTVETLGRIGSPEYLELIETIFETQAHPLIRVGCLQAVSGARGAATQRLASAGLKSQDANVQAAAVETLVTAGVPYDRYRDLVLGLLGNPHPKLALNASLACIAVEPKRAFQQISTLLSSGKPRDMLQAIQCLAYVEAKSSIEALRQIISRCPAGAMRIQAVRALGRLATRTPDAVKPLTKILELDDPESQEAAIWFLASSHPAGRVEASKAITDLLRLSGEKPIGPICIEALGLLGPAGQLSVPDLHHALLVGPKQANAAARALAISFPRSKEATDLRNSESSLLQGYGGIASWFESGEGLEMLFQALSQKDSYTFRIACGVARLAGAAGSWTAETRRLVGLAKALGAANIDAAEAKGLGRLNQSLSVPRKKIGLGIVPKANPSARNLAPEKIQVSSVEDIQRVNSEASSNEALLSQSYFETAIEDVVAASPSQTGAVDRTNTTELQDSEGTRSRLLQVLQWGGLLIMCGLAVKLGQWLKTVF